MIAVLAGRPLFGGDGPRTARAEASPTPVARMNASKRIGVHDVAWPAELARDPFAVDAPVVPQAAPTPRAPTAVKLSLGSILYSATPMALINDQVVGVGGEVGGCTVLSIDRRRVVLDCCGSSVELGL